MTQKKPNAVESAVDELLTDPDAPQNSDTATPPQTVDAEPAREDKDAR
ncbi:hypothetical protein [Sphingomonas corticis]|jgi:hypothetical protein|uniref:Uncharacterized protein n=1 Tax=Sphingomonas corticis TaxID=2722791 RepID=A0ABX1CWA1_9SPHN|nr:hypothetical protein [Sphingomonas corticis]NJR80207.1 hypothetical protein [Sphingomonas corticis]